MLWLRVKASSANTRPGAASAVGSRFKAWATWARRLARAARHHFDLPQTIRFLLSTLAALDAQGLRPQAVLIEDAANGPAVQQTLKRKVPGLLPVPARGSKESRAHAVAPLLEAGQVRFHHRAAPLVEELPRFPKGTKDLVDAFGHGALWLETRYWRGLGIKRDPLPMLLTR